MSGTKLSGAGSRRAARHTWTTEQKRCLLVLFQQSKQFKLSPEETGTIFNDIFRQEISSQDFRNGLPYSSLIAQHREHKQSDNASWTKITKPESWETERKKREELLARIRQHLDPANGEVSDAVRGNGEGSPHSTPRTKKRKAGVLAQHRSGTSISEAAAPPAEGSSKVTRRAQMVMISSSEIRRRSEYLYIVDDDEITESSDTHVVTVMGPQTPKKSSRTIMPAGFTRTGLRQPPGFSLLKRRSGAPVWLNAEEKARALQGWVAPSRQEAHVPLAGLFFRFWDANHSRAKMGPDGIVAEKYAYSNCVPRSPPPVEYLDATDVLNHLDKQKKETPFVSVSDSLVWSLSKVLKKVKDGSWTNAQISVIDAHQLQAGAVLHALPFYRQLQANWALDNKTARGVSLHESLVWNKIPNAAILKTFAVSDVVKAAADSPALGRVLRLDVLAMSGDYQQVVRPRLQQSKLKISADVAARLAQVAVFVGLDHASTFKSHRYIINELVSAYGLLVEHLSEEQWQARAAAYAHVFCRQSQEPVTVKDQQKLKAAFLDGTCLGATKQFRWSKLSPDSPEKVQKTAQRIGLTGRDRVASNECDAAKLYLAMEQVKQRRLLAGRRSESLLADTVDGGSVFEMNDDGVVS